MKLEAIRLDVPAKINLWLEVIGKRSDGYHELSSLMLPIGVYDHIALEARAGGAISLECDHPEVPEDGRNLAWRAAERYLSALGQPVGVHIRLNKKIPVGAGLGGGSADAAAVLLGLNRMFGSSLPMEELHRIATTLGADVPFFLYQRPALATGIGERLEPMSGVPDYPLLLIKPPVVVSTARVYQSLKLTRGESRIKIHAFLAFPWQLREVMQNDLEAVTLNEYPVLAQLKQWLLDEGAMGAMMSGSGPTVFGIFAGNHEVEQVRVRAERVYTDCWIAGTKVMGLPAAGSS